MKTAWNTSTRTAARARDSWGLGAVLDRLGPSVFVGLLMPDGTVVHANQAALDAVGSTLNQVCGKAFDATPWWQHSQALQQRVRAAVGTAAAGESSRFEVQMQTVEGRLSSVDFSLHPVFGADGKVAFLVPSAIDISARRAAQARAWHLSGHDALTGLPNRRLLMRRLGFELQCAEKLGHGLSVLHIDLDKFSQVNAALGHAGGDATLLALTSRMQACAGPGDWLARLDGDDFVLVLGPDTSKRDAAMRFARALLAAVAAPLTVNDQEIFVTASIGMAGIDGKPADPEALLRNARDALDRAKRRGRNSCVAHARERFEPDPERFTLVAALRHAIQRNELHLVYQPQVDVVSGRVVGVEALLRWRHPVLGLVSPERFIPMAEEAGCIDAIGNWVVQTACATASEWQRAGLSALRMSVNISARQLRQSDFSARVAQVLRATGLEPGRFGIEVTERLLADDLDEAAAQLLRLRALGVEIALDDFGTGFSSLACLRRLPIDVVKIDRSLVAGITASGEALAITRAVIAMAHSLGMKVLAEGVENVGQLELLGAHRCDRYQGHHFSAPVAAERIDGLLRAPRPVHAPAPAPRPRVRVRSVLVVDDEREVVDRIALEIASHFGDTVQVESFVNARMALQRLRAGPVDVIVSDLCMPGMDGLALLGQARDIRPDAVRLLLLGPTDGGLFVNDERQVDVFRQVAKPAPAGQLLMHLQAALHQAEHLQTLRLLADADNLARCQPRFVAAALAAAATRPGAAGRAMAAVERGPLGEVQMPQALLTLPGDLWTLPMLPDKGLKTWA